MRVKFVIVLAITIILVVYPIHATTIQVGHKDCRYSSIQAAIDAAKPGDVIEV